MKFLKILQNIMKYLLPLLYRQLIEQYRYTDLNCWSKHHLGKKIFIRTSLWDSNRNVSFTSLLCNKNCQKKTITKQMLYKIFIKEIKPYQFETKNFSKLDPTYYSPKWNTKINKRTFRQRDHSLTSCSFSSFDGTSCTNPKNHHKKNEKQPTRQTTRSKRIHNTHNFSFVFCRTITQNYSEYPLKTKWLLALPCITSTILRVSTGWYPRYSSFSFLLCERCPSLRLC